MPLWETRESNEFFLCVGGSYDPTRFLLNGVEIIIRKRFLFAPDGRRFLILYGEVVVLLRSFVLEHFVCGGLRDIMYVMRVTVVDPLQFLDWIRIKEVYAFLAICQQDARMAFQPASQFDVLGTVSPVGVSDGGVVLGGVHLKV